MMGDKHASISSTWSFSDAIHNRFLVRSKTSLENFGGVILRRG